MKSDPNQYGQTMYEAERTPAQVPSVSLSHHLQSFAALDHVQGVQRVLMQAISLRAGQEVGDRQQHKQHEGTAKYALKADNLQRLHGKVSHEEVFKC